MIVSVVALVLVIVDTLMTGYVFAVVHGVVSDLRQLAHELN